ncbi:protein SSUH2 homolog [Lineus longissimus]|uniref:protein SSUH2 homolog n=1 Tax=Lineus longissimus TaxID=88925 RepID=UPI002B4C2A2B
MAAANPPTGPDMPGQGAYAGPPDQGGAIGQPDDNRRDDDSDSGSESDGSSPDLNGFQVYGGYEKVGGFGQDSELPPPPPPPKPTGEPPHVEYAEVANLKEEQCREAMLGLVAEKCCWGKKAAEGMTFNKITGSTALHYILQTFCEGRSTNYEHVPFVGQEIDGPQNGHPPEPWAIDVAPDEMFDSHQKKVEVPHTAVVKDCHRCQATGTIICSRCSGTGNTRCYTCGGDGSVRRYDARTESYENERCYMCNGSGRRSCSRCGGDGRVTCPVCKGHRQLKCYIALTVKFINHQEDFILEETDLPDELVREVSGNSIFEQTLPQVWPITAYPTEEINENSMRLVEKHRSGFGSERQLMQKHEIRAIPVTECDYKWKEEDRRFWVYGLDRMVHAPDYPQQCCWGCQIL